MARRLKLSTIHVLRRGGWEPTTNKGQGGGNKKKEGQEKKRRYMNGQHTTTSARLSSCTCWAGKDVGRETTGHAGLEPNHGGGGMEGTGK